MDIVQIAYGHNTRNWYVSRRGEQTTTIRDDVDDIDVHARWYAVGKLVEEYLARGWTCDVIEGLEIYHPPAPELRDDEEEECPF